MGGTGLGFNASVSQSLDYNFNYSQWSTTTSVSMSATLGIFTAGVNSSYTYNLTTKQGGSSWAATVGVGVGNSDGGIGFNVGYGSNGAIWGMGGWATTKSRSSRMTTATKSAKTKTPENEIRKSAWVVDDDPVVKEYIQSMAGKSDAAIISGLESMGYTVDQFTKSTMAKGQKVHAAYHVGKVGKEFTLPSGKRIDYLDMDNGVIKELKPFNPRQIRNGFNQLNMYLQEVNSPAFRQQYPQLNHINWKIYLDVY